MLGTLTIKTRVTAIIAFVGLLLLAGWIAGVGALYLTNQTVNSLYEDGLKAASVMGQITDSVGDSRAQIILSLQHAPENKFSATHDHPVSLHTDAMVKDIESITVLMRDIRDRQLAQEGKNLADKFAKTSDLYVRDGIRPARAAVLDGDYTRANEILQVKVNPLYQAAHGDAEALLGQLLDSARAAHDLAGERYLLVRNVCFAGGLIGLLLIAWSGRLLIRAVVEPLNEAAAVADAVTSGDLTRQIEIKSDDEVGQLLRAIAAMREKLADSIKQIKTVTGAVNTAADDIAQGNGDLLQRTEEQASSLEETASSMEELTTTVKQNAENAKQASQLAVGASEIALRGGAVVREVVDTMSAIRESSKNISDIIAVIDSIAFQTNILALNAAVEAARAGDQGRGFAVVAAEVRGLAQRSAAAAKEIKALIGDSVAKVGAGGKHVEEAGRTMEEIVLSVKRVTEFMSEITAASQEQSCGIEQVNQAIAQMDMVTQQNAALVEHAASVADSLEQQVHNLSRAVDVFRLDGAGLKAQALEPEYSAQPDRPAHALARPARLLQNW